MSLQAFISTPLESALVEKIRNAARGRVKIVYDPELLPAQRYEADHKGVEGFERTDAGLKRWLKHLAEADFLWDIPPLSMLPSQDLAWAPNLKWVQTTSSGVGPLIETLKFKSSNVLVTTAKGVHAVPLSEYVMMAILNHFKRYSYLKSEQSKQRWQRYCGESLLGKYVAIIGAGEVGHRVAMQCKGFGMYVAAMSRTLNEQEGVRRGYDRIFQQKNMIDVMAESDVVVLCVPHTPETENMINSSIFEAMKPGCLLVNIARGQIVDEAAMIESLQSKR
ncbi:MAG: NAD(P)-dependent oxidoreductase, partial [Paracoccaceae bacterium]|nr:NAD(P)-dependent oxidoreductase [Paracoccaceae bacterium]